MERTGYLYIITNKVNNKVYIGSTLRKPRYRKTEHWYALRQGTHGNHHLQHSWDKYGESQFSFAVHSTINAQDLCKAEQDLCLQLKSLDVKFGYNKAFPESTIRLYSKETRLASSKRCKENPPHKGYCHSEDTKQLLRDQKVGQYNGENNPNYGHKWTDEARQSQSIKISEAYNKNPALRENISRRRTGIPTRVGWVMTDQQKRKIQNSHKEKKMVIKMSESGEILESFPSKREWAHKYSRSRDLLKRIVKTKELFDGGYWSICGA